MFFRRSGKIERASDHNRFVNNDDFVMSDWMLCIDICRDAGTGICYKRDRGIFFLKNFAIIVIYLWKMVWLEIFLPTKKDLNTSKYLSLWKIRNILK